VSRHGGGSGFLQSAQSAQAAAGATGASLSSDAGSQPPTPQPETSSARGSGWSRVAGAAAGAADPKQLSHV